MAKIEAPFTIKGAVILPPPPPTPQLAPVTVVSIDSFGNNLPGYPVLISQLGVVVRNGFTPVTFDLTIGEMYDVTPQDFGNYAFERWSDGRPTRTRAVTPVTTAPLLMTVLYRSRAI